jgi:hypothetical protein
VLDALDETSRDRGCGVEDLLQEFYDRLPEWLGFVLTSRPELKIVSTLSDFTPYEIDTKSAENCADVERYVEDKIGSVLGPNENKAQCVQKLLDKTDGLFLYAKKALQFFGDQKITLRRLDALPKGLGKFYVKQLARLRERISAGTYEQVCQLLEVIHAAKEPLGVEDLARCLGLNSEADVRDAIGVLRGSLIRVSEDQEDQEDQVVVQPVVRVFHKSVTDFLDAMQVH